jgi:hypothetical protein
MGKHATWEVVNQKDNIIMIQDLDEPGHLSITNDAEYVLQHFNSTGNRYRVIYRSSVPDDWTEIIRVPGEEFSHWRVAFKPWHGLVWDRLTRE